MRVEPYLIDALAAGGNIFMPMGKTFWSPCFGMCNDQFGVGWMVGLDGPQITTHEQHRSKT